jgi:UDP-N-acetylmuramoylalanine-D-glutamate ligase
MNPQDNIVERQMPYKIRKAPNRELYWVVAGDGKHMSHEPLTRAMAEKQLTALNIAHARKKGMK